jgi:hypothetical protein
MSDKPAGTEIYIAGGMYVGMKGKVKPYPAWRYHKFFEPKLVRNTEQDNQASIDGWKEPGVPITALPHLVNWNLDLEDMNAEQLCVFALEEYGVDLPVEAGAEKLVKAIWHLARMTPDKGRMVLLAQSIEMNYDETVKQIQKAAESMVFDESYEIEM